MTPALRRAARGARRGPLTAPAALAALALGGCHSFSTLTTARTLERGRLQLLAAPQVTGAVGSSGAQALPQLELGARYGVTDRVDLGARVYYLGAAVRAGIQLARSPSMHTGADVALGPSLSFSAPNKLGLDLPLLFGWNVPGGSQFVLAPRLAYQAWFERGGQASRPYHFLFAGASVGFAWQVTPQVALLPEVAVLLPLAAEPGVSSIAGDGVAVQGGIGLLLGR